VNNSAFAARARTQVDGNRVVIEPVELKAFDLAIAQNPGPHDQRERLRTRRFLTLGLEPRRA
jgi:hypothetical protein